jgi:hypothetical protein
MSYPDITTTAFGPMSSMGVMTFGVGGLLPFPGKYLWVDEANGNDGQPGTANQPLGSLAAAYALCTSGHNDVVLFQGTQHTAATINWAKDRTHLIGLSAPCDNDRARISQTGSTFFTPLVNVTGQGCIFLNIGTFYGYVDALASVCWAEAGGRNYYGNCQLLGGGNATGAAQAGMRSLTIAGNGENLFNNCTVGLDTVVRATNANASLEFLSGTPRNVFRNSIFQMDTSLATNVHVKVGVGGIDRYALFDNCSFINAVESGSTTINAAITADASAGGAVILQNPMSLGATAIATAGPVYIIGNVPTANTSGIAIKAT